MNDQISERIRILRDRIPGHAALTADLIRRNESAGVGYKTYTREDILSKWFRRDCREAISIRHDFPALPHLPAIECPYEQVYGALLAWCDDALAESRLNNHATEDGLHAPNLLTVDGQTIELTPLNWKLASFMWVRKSATFDDASDEVWGHDQDVSDSSIRSAVTRLNKQLRDKLPEVHRFLDLSTKNSHIVNSPSP